MLLLYDPRDDAYHERIGSQLLYWLDDVGAAPLTEASPSDEGFLFGGARPIDDYRQLVAALPLLRDRPEEREPLLRLDSVLRALSEAGVDVPAPRTWLLPLDAALPDDLTFPLFLRTAESSWVTTPAELADEAAELRRALG
jgi:hypothetical protein